MHFRPDLCRRGFVGLLILMALCLGACGKKETVTSASFVGKWKSSRLETPILLTASGEWEIRKEGSDALEYGVWEYRNGVLWWSFKHDSTISMEGNPVQSVKPGEFRLKERDGSISTFTRLD